MGRPRGSKNKAKDISDAAAHEAPVPEQESKADAAKVVSINSGKPVSGRKPTKQDYERYFNECNRYREQASEYAGNAGKTTEMFVERWNVSKAALAAARKIVKMDRAKQATYLADFWHILEVLGINADDTATLLDGAGEGRGPVDREAVADMEEMAGEDMPEALREPPPPREEFVDDREPEYAAE